MAKRVLAILGTYRKGGISDQAVDEILRGAEDNGALTSKIYLIDGNIEFCVNCRKCTQDVDVKIRQRCVHDDELEGILEQIDAADGIVLACPTNFGRVTAVMKRFIERLVSYTYWAWDSKSFPKLRIQTLGKKGVTFTSTAAPAFFGRFFMSAPMRLMKQSLKLVGAKTVDSVRFGLVADTIEHKLDEKQLKRAYKAGCKLVS